MQGRDAATGAPTAIVGHADVRRMLLTARAWSQGMRALALWTALELDASEAASDPTRREQASALVALMTPVVKAAGTDLGLESTILAQQVFGGHGYIREWGVEQLVRDVRVTQIYEGTNGVQAMDLAVDEQRGFARGPVRLDRC
jgi:alkylation response protein AidB-like acyl-CoA dehydrogenase